MSEKKYKYFNGRPEQNLENANFGEWTIVPYYFDQSVYSELTGGFGNDNLLAIMLGGMQIVDVNAYSRNDKNDTGLGSHVEFLLKRGDEFFVAYCDDGEEKFYIARVDDFEVEQ